MRTTHTIVATYPLAGSEDGLPVEIRFTYEPASKYRRWSPIGPAPPPDIRFGSVMPLCAESLPDVIRSAIKSWAEEWLDGHGFDRAWDKALDDTERQRESARDMGMIRS